MSTAARRVDLGLCRDCCEPPAPGRRRCRAHLAANAERTKAHRARLDGKLPESPPTPVARCRCGLALPCNDCIPSARFFALHQRQ